MTWLSIGSLSLPFQMQRHGAAMRSSISQLSTELATGTVASVQKHLGGDLAQLAAIDARTHRLTQYETNAKLEATNAAAAQTALTTISSKSQELASSLLTLSQSSGSATNFDLAQQNANSALGTILSALSTSVAGRSLFSGDAPNSAPLPSAQTVLNALRPLVSGANSASDVIAAITNAIDTPGGVFETTLYLGGGKTAGAKIEDGEQTKALPTAADPAIRKALIAVTAGIFAGDPALNLNAQQRNSLVKKSAELLLSNGSELTKLQEALGDTQSKLDAHMTRIKGEKFALTQGKQALIGTDPYEVATKLQNTQTQLEAIYMMTARTARLTLTEYLR